MTRTILVLAVIGAFVLGSIATGTIAFADDDDDDNKGNSVKKLLKKILNAIEQQESTPTQVSGLSIRANIIPDGCTPNETSGDIGIEWAGSPTGFFSPYASGEQLIQVDVTETSFVARGYFRGPSIDCAGGTTDLPQGITITGGCGVGAAIEISTTGGATGSGTGNVVCIP